MCSILLLPFSCSQAQLHVTFSSNTVLESFDVEYVGTRRLPILKSSMQYKIPRIVKSTESESTLVDAGARAGQGGGGGVSGCLVTLFNPRNHSPRPLLTVIFFRQEYWSGLPFPPPGDLPTWGLKPHLLCLPHRRQVPYQLSHWGSPSYALVVVV